MRIIPAATSAWLILAVLDGTVVAAPGQGPQVVPQRRMPGVTIYPILAQIPLFGMEVDIPPSEGGEPGTSGSTDVSLNSAFVSGITVEGRRWLLDTNGLWAAVAASHSLPLIKVDSNIRFFNAVGGVRIVKGLFAVAGIRRISADLDVTLTEASQTSTLSGRASPAVWDPMIGVDYRGRISPRIRFDIVFKGGGFGVGTDVDLSAEAAIDWDITRHFVLRAGYSVTYYKWTIDGAEIEAGTRTLISKQTLHGPEIGIGIRF